MYELSNRTEERLHLPGAVSDEVTPCLFKLVADGVVLDEHLLAISCFPGLGHDAAEDEAKPGHHRACCAECPVLQHMCLGTSM